MTKIQTACSELCWFWVQVQVSSITMRCIRDGPARDRGRFGTQYMWMVCPVVSTAAFTDFDTAQDAEDLLWPPHFFYISWGCPRLGFQNEDAELGLCMCFSLSKSVRFVLYNWEINMHFFWLNLHQGPSTISISNIFKFRHFNPPHLLLRLQHFVGSIFPWTISNQQCLHPIFSDDFSIKMLCIYIYIYICFF